MEHCTCCRRSVRNQCNVQNDLRNSTVMYNVRRGVLQKVSAESVEHTNWNSNMIHMVHQLLRVRVRVRVACEDVRPNLLQTCEELLLLLLLLLCLLHALKSHGNGLGENGLLLLLLLLLLLHALQSQGNWLGDRFLSSRQHTSPSVKLSYASRSTMARSFYCCCCCCCVCCTP